MKISFKKSAEKELLAVNKKLAQRIFNKIQDLTQNPFPSGYQKLEGINGYRIRVGNYRIVYTIDSKNEQITIFKIGHRKDIYRF